MIKKIKKVTLSIMLTFLMAIGLVLPSAAVSAQSASESRIVETPAAIEEAISELRQNESENRVFSFSTPYSVDDPEVIILTIYRDRNFYGKSAREFIDLQTSCTTISLTGTCENGEDLLVFHLEDRTHGGDFNTTIPFKADGSVTTIVCELPDGQYAGYFTGSGDIKKTDVQASFSYVNTSILSDSSSVTASSNAEIPNNIIYISDKKQKLAA